MKHVLLSNNISLSYIDEGEGDTVVLLHGFCGSSAYWKEVYPSLAEKYRVIVPDLRGHGLSSVAEQPFTISDMSQDIALLLESLHISKAMLFGHSLGGYITLAFAENYQEKLAGFALIHSSGYPDDEAGKENRTKAIHSIQEHGMEPFMRTLAPKLFAPTHVTSMKEKVEEIKEIGLATPRLGAMHTLAAMRDRPDRNHVITAATARVLLLAGSEDQIIPAEKTLIADLPHVTQVKLEGVGHISMLEAPNKLLHALHTFLDKANGE